MQQPHLRDGQPMDAHDLIEMFSTSGEEELFSHSFLSLLPQSGDALEESAGGSGGAPSYHSPYSSSSASSSSAMTAMPHTSSSSSSSSSCASELRAQHYESRGGMMMEATAAPPSHPSAFTGGWGWSVEGSHAPAPPHSWHLPHQHQQQSYEMNYQPPPSSQQQPFHVPPYLTARSGGGGTVPHYHAQPHPHPHPHHHRQHVPAASAPASFSPSASSPSSVSSRAQPTSASAAFIPRFIPTTGGGGSATVATSNGAAPQQQLQYHLYPHNHHHFYTQQHHHQQQQLPADLASLQLSSGESVKKRKHELSSSATSSAQGSSTSSASSSTSSSSATNTKTEPSSPPTLPSITSPSPAPSPLPPSSSAGGGSGVMSAPPSSPQHSAPSSPAPSALASPGAGWSPSASTSFMSPPHTLHPPHLHSSPSSSTSTLYTPSAVLLPAKPLDRAHQLLEQLELAQMEQKELLHKFCSLQLQLVSQPSVESYQYLDAEQKQLKAKLEEELKFVNEINRNFLLQPTDLYKQTALKQELEIQAKQLELYNLELQLLMQSPAPRCIAALVVIKQPFPMVLTKNKQVSEDTIQVQLLCGATTTVQSCSPVKASMIIDSHQVQDMSEKALGNNVQPLDPGKRIARFPLRFQIGTRKSCVSLKFSMQLKVGLPLGSSASSSSPSGSSSSAPSSSSPSATASSSAASLTATVESDTSRDFIVITNEIQWQGSAGTLLKRDAFGGQLGIPWPQFANALQRHLLKATKQDSIRPARCLSAYDLKYIKATFFGNKDELTLKDFDTFWNWFGKNLQILRYQRHISKLWQQGLIYGFLTRTDVTEALKGHEPGTFLLRFSERHPGQFGIAYVGMSKQAPGEIKHYLVQKSDTAGAKKTLPDFLGECPQFRFLLQLSTDPTTGKAVFRKLQKDTCLKPFYSKRDPPPSGSGYDPL